MTKERRLYPSTRQLLDAPDDARVRHIKTDHFIPHHRVQKLLEEINDLINHPPTHRMPNRLILGETNNGKSMVVLRFLKEYPPELNEDGNAIKVPVLYILMPAIPRERAFYLNILETLGAKYREYASTADLGILALKILKKVDLKLMIIDEIHNILGGDTKQRKEMLRIIRDFCNKLRVPFVGCGTHEALSAIAIDDQLANRFVPLAMPKWRANNETRAILNSLEMSLPLRDPSSLSNDDMMRKILTLSEGTIGEIVALIRIAAIAAIKSGDDRISMQTLERANYTPPSIRRAQAEKILGVSQS